MRLQLLIAFCLLLALTTGGVWYWQRVPEGIAEAAVGGAARSVPVEVVRAEAGTVRERVEAVGTTLARQAVDIVPLTSGRLAALPFAPGEQVAAGAVLARLDDAAERASVAEAAAAVREAELALERARRLRTNNTVAQATVDELEAAYLGARARLDGAQKDLDDRTVRAPFAGLVGMRRVDVGARVDDETVLTTLDDLSEVEIEFSVPEVFFGRVRVGQPVEATSSAFSGQVFSGRIRSVDTRIGQISRAVKVRAVLPNPDLALPAGMFMHVDVVLEERPAVLIPEEAVVAEGSGTFVYVAEEGRAARRTVRLGQRRAGEVEVLDGVDVGAAVIRTGLQQLREGASIEVRNEPRAEAAEGA
ncbi:MAG TPA: efflux RND transporter periplasmic adaptor subunit [Geminicoccaceae bacterium]